MIKSGEFANQEQVERSYKEAKAAAQLTHPGIVPVHEVREIDGQHYFTMGFVDGESLADRLRNGPLHPREAARYAKSIAEAVAYAHSKGVIHRDLKPGNVLITNEGTVQITDFGLAKRIEEDSELTMEATFPLITFFLYFDIVSRLPECYVTLDEVGFDFRRLKIAPL